MKSKEKHKVNSKFKTVVWMISQLILMALLPKKRSNSSQKLNWDTQKQRKKSLKSTKKIKKKDLKKKKGSKRKMRSAKLNLP